ncbi:MAG: 4-hydroxy-tetrahydrodipicolinate reductase [Demequinaceae bacterium]|nr:4-hydroxy-tetrahydrodipicolinate reductase [Demequinaceae bacterium]
MIKVAVIGAAGRMGATVVRAVEDAPDLELAAALDMDDDVAAATAAGATVAVEFTVPSSTEANVHALLEAGLHVVSGTSGWTEDAIERVRDRLMSAPGLGVLIAPNFALGAVLALRFAEMAAPYFESAEVIELHHPDKIDAPSGTARSTAHRIASSRTAVGLGPMPDATASSLEGARGASVDGIPVHSVRLRGLVAHEEILFGNPGEILTLRHDSLDRASFMPGVLLGIRRVAEHPGLAVGLDSYLDL